MLIGRLMTSPTSSGPPDQLASMTAARGVAVGVAVAVAVTVAVRVAVAVGVEAGHSGPADSGKDRRTSIPARRLL